MPGKKMPAILSRSWSRYRPSTVMIAQTASPGFSGVVVSRRKSGVVFSAIHLTSSFLGVTHSRFVHMFRCNILSFARLRRSEAGC